MTAQETNFWHSMAFADADRMIEWLKAIGFTEHAAYRDETDATIVMHAEWLWPGGGGIMFGSRDPTAPSTTWAARRRTSSPTTSTGPSNGP